MTKVFAVFTFFFVFIFYVNNHYNGVSPILLGWVVFSTFVYNPWRV